MFISGFSVMMEKKITPPHQVTLCPYPLHSSSKSHIWWFCPLQSEQDLLANKDVLFKVFQLIWYICAKKGTGAIVKTTELTEHQDKEHFSTACASSTVTVICKTLFRGNFAHRTEAFRNIFSSGMKSLQHFEIKIKRLIYLSYYLNKKLLQTHS